MRIDVIRFRNTNENPWLLGGSSFLKSARFQGCVAARNLPHGAKEINMNQEHPPRMGESAQPGTIPLCFEHLLDLSRFSMDPRQNMRFPGLSLLSLLVAPSEFPWISKQQKTEHGWDGNYPALPTHVLPSGWWLTHRFTIDSPCSSHWITIDSRFTIHHSV